jgi:hypothetical protein
VPDGGANFNLVYKSEGNGWSDTAIPSTGSQWPWVNGGNTYYDVNFTDADITALAGQNIYIVKGENSTISKVVLTGEVTPTAQTELLDASWTASWTAKTFAAQSGAKIGDVIRFSYSAPGGWSYFQFNILDAYGNADAFTNTSTNVGTSIGSAAYLTFDFEINNYSDMVKIQMEGFGIKGDNFTLTSVQLLTYADSYDAVSITVGSDGIATYSNGSKNVQISACDALKAYYASAVATGAVTLTELTCIPANQGVIIKGAKGTYTVKVGGEGWEDLSNINYLKPSNGGTTVTASTTGAYHYIFAKKSSGTPAFYKLTQNHTLAAHKAYLETTGDITPSTPPSGNAPSIMLDFGNGTTAIMDVFQDEMKQQQAQEDNVYYTLQGTRVQNPTKGLYILNGKKIIVK